MIDRIRYAFVKLVYADHNDSRPVHDALRRVLAGMPADGIGLNIGAGRTRIDPRIRNLELEAGEGIDLVGSVEAIPCADRSFDLVVTQEVLEHVRSPQRAMREIHRVLRAGGTAYVQLPWTIGHHPCPNDYWRFSHEGLVELVRDAGFDVVETGMAVGPAVGFYRIAVEFFATVFATIHRTLYLPAKSLFALVLWPVKLLDPLMRGSAQAHRIAGGWFVICRKP
jgi:SAM-dependent methyltransferase